ncbi:MAG: homogentisate 1,2-dioxygenase [Gammaproteobacteria bacterium]
MKNLDYLAGFGNYFESEALPGTLPKGQNSPQKPAHGLYAEQISGAAFTMPRHLNAHSWLYRLLPSVTHKPFEAFKNDYFPYQPVLTGPNQSRWDPMPLPTKPTNFVEGLRPFACNGCTVLNQGGTIYLYTFNQSMKNTYFYNADGDFLIVPQDGELLFHTEFGKLAVSTGEIIVIPRGIKFTVELLSKTACGYICENHGEHFNLPERGLIGANGLANTRDFLIPTACYEDKKGSFNLISKFNNHLWIAEIDHSPLDVVAWHGTYTPYKYDLRLFNTIGSVSFDHPDPSIFTVLNSVSEIPQTSNIDFVIFPERWLVSEYTFRPPYFHRNKMSEFMGLIFGRYDAKEEGFAPGGASLHNCMSAHGPDFNAWETATNETLKPHKEKDTLAFMFESRFIWLLTEFADSAPFKQEYYSNCWQGFIVN